MQNLIGRQSALTPMLKRLPALESRVRVHWDSTLKDDFRSNMSSSPSEALGDHVRKEVRGTLSHQTPLRQPSSDFLPEIHVTA